MISKNFALSFSLCAALSPLAQADQTRLSADLHEVTNLKQFRKDFSFKPAHLQALRKNMFFTCPSSDNTLYWVYGRNDYQELPSIVTSDNVLQIYHIFFEFSLRSIEETRLLPDLQSVTKAMLERSVKTYGEAKGTKLERAALKNVAYFGVASKLMGLDVSVPSEADALIGREMSLTKDAQGISKGAIFPYDIDYSQFIVRGHYTRTPKLGEYFRAMMWYGLVPFSSEKRERGAATTNPEQVWQAILIARDLSTSGAETKWQKIYDVTSLFAGRANNLTPHEWRGVANKVFGAQPALNDYANTTKLNRFVESATALRPPLIVPKRNQGTVAVGAEFRFMGQRSIPDSYILQELCDPDKRPFPNPLDVMAVLGSTRAKTILDQNPAIYNPQHWVDYKPERQRVTGEFASKSGSEWSRDLYSSWLDCLRKAIAKPAANYPLAMRTPAWTDKSLYSALASWAELRHDTILYGYQSSAEMGDGEEPKPVKGYVEPNIAVYERLHGMIVQTMNGIKAQGYLTDKLKSHYEDYLKMVTFFEKVSAKELAGQKLTPEEHKRIRYIEGELESAHNEIQMDVLNYNAMTEDDQDIATVADVHTALGHALTVGVGRADHLFAVVPIDGKLTMTRGAAFSYYEFLVPSSARMTDETWKKQLKAGKFPPRPAWTKSFYVPLPVKGDKE